MAWRGIAAVMIIIAVCLAALRNAADLLVDWLWFSAVGYSYVFLTILGAKAALFFAVLTISFICLWMNGFLAYRVAESPRASPGGGLSVGIDRIDCIVSALAPAPMAFSRGWRRAYPGGPDRLGRS